MRVYYCDEFVLPLPAGHRFPMSKYRRLREHLIDAGIVSLSDLHVPAAATDADLLRVHTAEFVERATRGDLDRAEVRRIGFPWSRQLVERSRRSVGGTIAACRAALAGGVSVNLAGGTHHSFADHGEGYCVFNDAAVATRAVQASGEVDRVAIVDCDVHQGNGTASIFQSDPTVFTFSIHGRSNFPFRKECSDLDVALEDGADDARYLAALDTGLRDALDAARAQLVVYVAGADPYAHDRLGRLALTREGLEQRDRLVLSACRRRRLPVAVVMAGGYCEDLERIVQIHARTVAMAIEQWFEPMPRSPGNDTDSGRAVQ